MDKKSKDQIQMNSRFALGGSLIGGLGALIGTSCCVLPLVLFNFGVGSAVVAQLGFFARYRDLFFVGACLLLAIGIAAAFWDGRKPTRRVVASFFLSALMICAAYILPFYEPELLRFFGFRG